MDHLLHDRSAVGVLEPAAASAVDWCAAVPALVRAARRHLSPVLLRHTTAEDIVQDAIVGVLASARYRQLPAPKLLAVLRCVLRRVSCHVHRSLHRQRRCVRRELDGESYPVDVLAADRGPGPAELAEQAELRALVMAGLLALRPADARVLRLRLERHGLADVGQELGVHVDSARKRWERALDRLRLQLRATGLPTPRGRTRRFATVVGTLPTRGCGGC